MDRTTDQQLAKFEVTSEATFQSFENSSIADLAGSSPEKSQFGPFRKAFRPADAAGRDHSDPSIRCTGSPGRRRRSCQPTGDRGWPTRWNHRARPKRTAFLIATARTRPRNSSRSGLFSGRSIAEFRWCPDRDHIGEYERRVMTCRILAVE